ncbi:transmembrane protein 150A-like isoform X1 [Polyodon spathula]|uniref:transmembrane protein 150A-like isoform X1 n=1 Tax=Polyodon spathula TaxID=7913 RepID=UPI001B7DAC95|nr:transmembrane protein 150A-like isoform X1 [Polyodon spathula]
MFLWMLLPASLPVFTITGMWIVYALAVFNQHVCPVENWVYNLSCKVELAEQEGPEFCCTPDNIPLVSKCGTLPPESCLFSLICSTGSFMVMVVGLLRYAHVTEKHQNCSLNTAALSTGWICAAGLIVVGNFQVDNAKVLHYIGAGIAFPTSMLFACLQSALTYRLAKTGCEYGVGHLRSSLTLLAFITLVLSIFYTVYQSPPTLYPLHSSLYSHTYPLHSALYSHTPYTPPFTPIPPTLYPLQSTLYPIPSSSTLHPLSPTLLPLLPYLLHSTPRLHPLPLHSTRYFRTPYTLPSTPILYPLPPYPCTLLSTPYPLASTLHPVPPYPLHSTPTLHPIPPTR